MTRFSQIRYSSGAGPSGGGGPGGFIGRAIAFVVGVIVLGLSLFIGAAVFLTVLGLVVIGGIIFALRVWWMKRKMEAYQREHGDLSAEYTVIEEDRADRD